MKKPVLFVLACLISLSIYGAESKSVTLRFDINDFEITVDSCGVTHIESLLPYSFVKTDASEPALPYFVYDLELTEGEVCNDYDYCVVNTSISKGVKLSSAITLPTSSAMVVSSLLPDFVGADRLYPEKVVEFVGSHNKEDLVYNHYYYTPFVYDGSNGELFFIEKLDVNFKIESNLLAQKTSRESELKQMLMKTSTRQNSASVDPSGSESDELEYLIITNQKLKKSFEPLLKWKNTKGVKAGIKTVEEIDKAFVGDDIVLKIKKYILWHKLSSNLKFVLLGGDDTVIPARQCYGRVNSMEDYTIPTDLYYACFGKQFDWDANGNGIYGETDDNVDMQPSVYITRAPVRKEEHVGAFVKKTLEYELCPKINNKLLLSGKKMTQYVKNENETVDMANRLLNGYIQPGWTGDVDYMIDAYHTVNLSHGLPAYGVDNMRSMLSDGYAFISVISHGEQTCWYTDTGNYACSHALVEKNNAHTIITTMACLTNAFDCYSSDWTHDPSLSEGFIRGSDNGVVAYLGASREGLYTPNDFGPSLLFEGAFYDNLFNNSSVHKNFGRLVADAKSEFIANSIFDTKMRWVQFCLNPIGDPEMSVHTTAPLKIRNPGLNVYKDRYVITPIPEGSRVCIRSLDSEIYRVYNDVESITLDEISQDLYVCVTKPGYVPCIFKIIPEPNLSIYTYHNHNNYVNSLLKFEEPVPDLRYLMIIYMEKHEGIFKVHLSDECPGGRVVLRNLNGDMIRSANADSQIVEISSEGLKPGVYIVTLETNSGVLDSKQIIKK